MGIWYSVNWHFWKLFDQHWLHPAWRRGCAIERLFRCLLHMHKIRLNICGFARSQFQRPEMPRAQGLSWQMGIIMCQYTSSTILNKLQAVFISWKASQPATCCMRIFQLDPLFESNSYIRALIQVVQLIAHVSHLTPDKLHCYDKPKLSSR